VVPGHRKAIQPELTEHRLAGVDGQRHKGSSKRRKGSALRMRTSYDLEDVGASVGVGEKLARASDNTRCISTAGQRHQPARLHVGSDLLPRGHLAVHRRRVARRDSPQLHGAVTSSSEGGTVPGKEHRSSITASGFAPSAMDNSRCCGARRFTEARENTRVISCAGGTAQRVEAGSKSSRSFEQVVRPKKPVHAIQRFHRGQAQTGPDRRDLLRGPRSTGRNENRTPRARHPHGLTRRI